MVDMELTSRCFHAVSLAWSSLKQPNTALLNSPDFDWSPVKTPLEIVDGDFNAFQWKTLHAVWSADSWDTYPSIFDGLLQSGHDFSIFFEPFGINAAQCQSDEVSFEAIKDALYEDQSIIQKWEDELDDWNDEL